MKAFFNKYITKDAAILDVGCGNGTNMTILKNQGYNNITGCDISHEMISICRHKNLQTIELEDLTQGHQTYDVLLVSHVIEHIGYPQITDFLNFYLSKLRDGGKMIIITPLLSNKFYTDIDHIKPYNIDALLHLFNTQTERSQAYSKSYNCELIDIEFRRERFDFLNYRQRYIKNTKNYILDEILKILSEMVKILSLSMIARSTGYIALLQKNPKE